MSAIKRRDMLLKTGVTASLAMDDYTRRIWLDERTVSYVGSATGGVPIPSLATTLSQTLTVNSRCEWCARGVQMICDAPSGNADGFEKLVVKGERPAIRRRTRSAGLNSRSG